MCKWKKLDSEDFENGKLEMKVFTLTFWSIYSYYNICQMASREGLSNRDFLCLWKTVLEISYSKRKLSDFIENFSGWRIEIRW